MSGHKGQRGFREQRPARPTAVAGRKRQAKAPLRDKSSKKAAKVPARAADLVGGRVEKKRESLATPSKARIQSAPPIGSPSSSNLIAQVASGQTVDPGALAEGLGLAKGQLASMIGLPADALYRPGRTSALKTQTRMREVIEILMRVEPWAGGRLQALAWYRGQSIPSLGDQTAEALVKVGDADLVRSYLDRVADGGYA